MPNKDAIREAGLIPLRGESIFLREIAFSDVGDRYLGWMNDSVLNQYLESRFVLHTMDSLKAFVSRQLASERDWMFAICANESEQHIGNIKLGPVNAFHKVGEVGLLVGEKEWHSRGIATQAIDLVSRFAFGVLELRRVTAGMYAANIGSRKAFEKCGFKLEGVLKRHYLCDGDEMDGYRMALLRETV